MSLLNNMLSDIEKRKVSAAAQSLPESVILTTRSRRSGGNSLLLLGLVTIAVAVVAFVWFNYQKTEKTDVQPVAAASQPVPVQFGSAMPADAMPAVMDAPLQTAANIIGETPPDQAVTPVAGAAPLAAAPQAAVTHPGSATIAAGQVTLAATSASPPADPPMVKKLTPDTTKATSRASDRSKAQGRSKAPSTSKAPATSEPSSDRTASFKTVSPQQRSDNYYRQALTLLQQSRDDEAKQALEQALEITASNHPARQLLAELLAETGQNAEAQALLHEGLSLAPRNIGFSMMLAQVQAVGDLAAALATLEQGLQAAADDAAYHALLAALLQRQERHAEAIQHYITALRSNPMMPNWLIGAGISMQAENQWDDADAAFQRALDSGELSDEVAQFVSKQLASIRQQRK